MTEAKKPGRPLSKTTEKRMNRVLALQPGASTTFGDATQNDIRGLREVLNRRGVRINATTTAKGLKITRREEMAQ